jgi:hypothetical protein
MAESVGAGVPASDELAPVEFFVAALTAFTLAGFMAAVCALGVHRECYDAAPPVSVPDPGTPRADYCSALEHVSLVPALILIPLVATGIVLVVFRRRPVVAAVLVGVIIVAILVNLEIAVSLEHSLTI